MTSERGRERWRWMGERERAARRAIETSEPRDESIFKREWREIRRGQRGREEKVGQKKRGLRKDIRAP